jgi:hypothetical protein
MYKSFRMWLEERKGERNLKHMLLNRLGFEPHAMDTTTIKLRDLNRNHVKKALGTMGLDPDTVQNLQNFVDTNPDTTLQNVLDQLDSSQVNDQDKAELPSEPAKLPKGQKKPLPQQKPQQEPMGQQQPPDMGAAMNSFMGQYGQTFGQ